MKKILLIFILIFTINAFSHNSQIDSEGYYKYYGECINRSKGITYEIVECNNQEIDRQDKLLNFYYKKLMNNLSEYDRKRLKKAQIDWIKWRDSDISFLSHNIEGSMSLIIIGYEYLKRTIDRVQF